MTPVEAMQTRAAGLPFACGGVVCEETRLLEIESGRVMVEVHRETIRRIRSRHGLVAPHPILQVIMGALLTALAYFPTAHLFHWFRHGGVLLEPELYVIPLAVVGIWMIISAFRRGEFLEIEMNDDGRKRLAFTRGTQAGAIDGFITAIERVYELRVGR